MYIATTTRAKSPWYVPQLHKEYYTYEGLIQCIYNHVDYFVEDLKNGRILAWIENQLGMKELVDNLRGQEASGDQTMRLMATLLKGSAYTASLDLVTLEESYKVYLETPINLRYKLKGDEALEGCLYAEALKYYKKALAISYSPEVENNIGIAYMALDHENLAMKAFSRAIDYEDRLEFRLNRIKLNGHMGHYEAMLKDLVDLQDKDDVGEVWYQYGLAYEGLSHSEEAMAAYMKAVDLSDDYKYIKGFVSFAVREGSSQLVEVWMGQHPLDPIKNTYIKSRLARGQKDYVTYVRLMECLCDLAPNYLPTIFELIDYFINHGQIIRALEFMGRIPKEFQSMEEVWYYKVIISRAAGNMDNFHHQVAELTDKWKNEARKAAVR